MLVVKCLHLANVVLVVCWAYGYWYVCACVRAVCRMGVSDILILVCESDLAYGGGLGKPKTVGQAEMTNYGENVGSP